MRVGFMGRTRMLLDTIIKVQQDSRHDIAFIWTSKAESFYKCEQNEFKGLSESIGCPFYYSVNVSQVLQSADFCLNDYGIETSFGKITSSLRNRLT